MRIFPQKNPHEIEQSNVFQTLSPQKINNPNQKTRNYFKSTWVVPCSWDSTTFSHMINRSYPRNAEASSVKSIHSPIHSTPCFQPKTESTEICSQNQFNVFRKAREPDKYDGTNVELPDYSRPFEQVTLWNRWSDSEKAIKLAISLRGRVHRILSKLSTKQLSKQSKVIYSTKVLSL